MNNDTITSAIDLRKKRLSKLAFLCAISGTITVIVFPLLAGLNFPNYNHLTQFISELGARNAPNEYLVRYAGFLPAGILLCFFTLFALLTLPKSRMTTIGLLGLCYFAVGYIVAAFFPCDPGCRPAEPSLSQLIHNFVGGLGYIAGALGLIAIGTQARKWTKGSMLSSLAFLLGITALLATSFTVDYAGLTQRITEISILSWIVYCGYYLKQNKVEELYY